MVEVNEEMVCKEIENDCMKRIKETFEILAEELREKHGNFFEKLEIDAENLEIRYVPKDEYFYEAQEKIDELFLNLSEEYYVDEDLLKKFGLEVEETDSMGDGGDYSSGIGFRHAWGTVDFYVYFKNYNRMLVISFLDENGYVGRGYYYRFKNVKAYFYDIDDC